MNVNLCKYKYNCNIYPFYAINSMSLSEQNALNRNVKHLDRILITWGIKFSDKKKKKKKIGLLQLVSEHLVLILRINDDCIAVVNLRMVRTRQGTRTEPPSFKGRAGTKVPKVGKTKVPWMIRHLLFRWYYLKSCIGKLGQQGKAGGLTK